MNTAMATYSLDPSRTETVYQTALYFFIAGHLYLRNPPTSIFLLHYFDDR
jgi:hypothetical protein